jgi:hypothetical protein
MNDMYEEMPETRREGVSPSALHDSAHDVLEAAWFEREDRRERSIRALRSSVPPAPVAPAPIGDDLLDAWLSASVRGRG